MKGFNSLGHALDHIAGSEYIRVAEAVVTENVERKFDRITARNEAQAQYRRDVRSWAAIADKALCRAVVYESRRNWVNKVLDAGLLDDREEAARLATILYPHL